jgi:arginyl-tRNA synthetase
MDYKKYIASKLNIEGFSTVEIESLIMPPPNTELGDYAIPCFKFAKIFKKAPQAIAEELKSKIATDDYISEINCLGGYLNFKINRINLTEKILKEINEENENYGRQNIGNNKTVCIDLSSINIAKPFHIGHLSTTVIGGALYRIYKFLGYNVIGINHLGDYGTQFGKLISAYKRWGNKDAVEKGKIKELSRLYVYFHEQAEKDPTLEDEARLYFKKIEDGDKECNNLFEWFKELTLEDVNKIYKRLDIHFDSYAGESFYNDKMQPVIDILNEKGLLRDSNGAKIVDLSKYDMSPCLILKADGASLYATRDLAAAIYRKKTYDFYKCLYVVAYQQNLHFQQFFKVLELMGEDFAKDLVHVSYGMVSLEEGTMSTRKGNVVFLEDVINKCIEKSFEVIDSKNPELKDKTEISEIVGTGAVIFGALYNNKIKDIVFSYDKVLNFDGETGPYVQYTCARCNSLLKKAGLAGEYKITQLCEQEYELINKLNSFKEIIIDAHDKYEPSYITRYSVELAQKFNKFYFDLKIIGSDENTKNFRLNLTKATLIVLKNSLSLLGIGVPEQM